MSKETCMRFFFEEAATNLMNPPIHGLLGGIEEDVDPEDEIW